MDEKPLPALPECANCSDIALFCSQNMVLCFSAHRTKVFTDFQSFYTKTLLWRDVCLENFENLYLSCKHYLHTIRLFRDSTNNTILLTLLRGFSLEKFLIEGSDG